MTKSENTDLFRVLLFSIHVMDFFVSLLHGKMPVNITNSRLDFGWP